MANEAPPVDLDKRPLRYRQRQELEHEINVLTQTDRSEEAAKAFRTGTSMYDRRTGKRALRKAEKMLADQMPPKLNTEQKNWLTKEITRLEERISTGMPTKQDMRLNPPGTVGRHMKWEQTNQKDIRRWQNAKVILEPDSEDPELCSHEQFRPEGQRWIATEEYREKYDRIDWPQGKQK
jgi:hypothetical protein